MGSTFLSLHYHMVFSAKDRRSFIQPAWRSQLHEIIGELKTLLDKNGVKYDPKYLL